MESLLPEVQTLVAQIASKNNITNYTLEENKSVSKEGDGYIGIINGLSVIDKDSDKKLNLVIKKAPTHENLRKQFPTKDLFLKEICMYEQVFPELMQFQEEYKVSNTFKSIPKLHGYISTEYKETLLLENLKEQGYKLCIRQEPLDSHHLSLIIIEYAKLHALSFAMKKLQPERFEKLKKLIGKNPMMSFTNSKPETPGGSGPPAGFDPASAVNHFFAPTMEVAKDKPKILEVLNKYKENCFKFMSIEGQEVNEYRVISHGDCWSANQLFKYEDKDTPDIPTKLMLIDWQMSMMSSPIHDLSYALYISAEKNDLVDYMKYLHIYHNALSDMLAAFGLDPEDIYPFELLEQQWNKKSQSGFFMTLVMMQQTLSEGKTHDFEELAKQGKEIFDLKSRKIEITDLFKKRMGDLLEFLVEHNFI